MLVKCTNFHKTDMLEIRTANDNAFVNMEIDNYDYRNLAITEENAFIFVGIY